MSKHPQNPRSESEDAWRDELQFFANTSAQAFAGWLARRRYSVDAALAALYPDVSGRVVRVAHVGYADFHSSVVSYIEIIDMWHDHGKRGPLRRMVRFIILLSEPTRIEVVAQCKPNADARSCLIEILPDIAQRWDASGGAISVYLRRPVSELIMQIKRPPHRDQGGTFAEWLNYYHECHAHGIRCTFESLASESGFSAKYLSKKNMAHPAKLMAEQGKKKGRKKGR